MERKEGAGKQCGGRRWYRRSYGEEQFRSGGVHKTPKKEDQRKSTLPVEITAHCYYNLFMHTN